MKQVTPNARNVHAWKADFRLNFLDMNPAPGAAPAAAPGHWILNDTLYAGMVGHLCRDYQSVEHLGGQGLPSCAPVTPVAVIEAMGLGASPKPQGLIEAASFTLRFVSACLRASSAARRHCAALRQNARPRAHKAAA
jgi:hypothetical protein